MLLILHNPYANTKKDFLNIKSDVLAPITCICNVVFTPKVNLTKNLNEGHVCYYKKIGSHFILKPMHVSLSYLGVLLESSLF